MVIGEKACVVEGRLYENKAFTPKGSFLILSGNRAMDVVGVTVSIENAFKNVLSAVMLPKYPRVRVMVERLEDGEDLEPVKEKDALEGIEGDALPKAKMGLRTKEEVVDNHKEE